MVQIFSIKSVLKMAGYNFVAIFFCSSVCLSLPYQPRSILLSVENPDSSKHSGIGSVGSVDSSHQREASSDSHGKYVISHSSSSAVKLMIQADGNKAADSNEHHIDFPQNTHNSGGGSGNLKNPLENSGDKTVIQHHQSGYNKVQTYTVKQISDHNYGIQFAKLESQDQDIKQNTQDKIPKMLLSVSAALVALFSMGIVAAIFGCCCPKKRRTDENENGDDGKADQNSQKKESSVEKDAVHHQNSRSSPEKENQSIQDKIKAFEDQKVPLRPSPDPVRPTKKRPETEAFKNFENSGMIIGMSRNPTNPALAEEETVSLDSDTGKPPIIEVSPAADATSETLSMDRSEHSNPDVVVATVDEDDEFGMIQRETSVLRSYRRAKPPKNRSPATRSNSRRRLRETPKSENTEGVPAEKKEKADAKPEKKEERSDKMDVDLSQTDNSEFTSSEQKSNEKTKRTSPKQRDKSPKVSPKPDKRTTKHIENSSTAVTSSSISTEYSSKLSDTTSISSDTPLRPVEKPSARKVHNGKDNSAIFGLSSVTQEPATIETERPISRPYGGARDNIFSLIDPTVKSKSVGDVNKPQGIQAEIKEKNSNPHESSSGQDVLVKALKHRLKDQSDSTSSNTTEETSPMLRERTQSDPSRKSTTLEQTAL